MTWQFFVVNYIHRFPLTWVSRLLGHIFPIGESESFVLASNLKLIHINSEKCNDAIARFSVQIFSSQRGSFKDESVR